MQQFTDTFAFIMRHLNSCQNRPFNASEVERKEFRLKRNVRLISNPDNERVNYSQIIGMKYTVHVLNTL